MCLVGGDTEGMEVTARDFQDVLTAVLIRESVHKSGCVNALFVAKPKLTFLIKSPTK